MEIRPPLPPFSREDAVAKVRAAENGWNTRDPERVAAAYTPDSRWRNRSEFFEGRPAVPVGRPQAEAEDHPGLTDLDL